MKKAWEMNEREGSESGQPYEKTKYSQYPGFDHPGSGKGVGDKGIRWIRHKASQGLSKMVKF
jgi:hypothetical protein